MIVDLLTRIPDHISVQGVGGDFEMNIKLLNGNVLDMLKTVADESVDCVMSSPPYYALRDYSGVATYSADSVDKVNEIAKIDLLNHRDRVPDHQKSRYYLTSPVFNEKKKKWYVSLKYDVSEIWGGNPECEHEWIIADHKYRSDVDSATTGNDKAGASHLDYYSDICSKCNAWKGQLGIEPSYEMYIDHLLMVMKELKRILKKTGTLFWNMGDSYASNGGPSMHMDYSNPKWDEAMNGSFEEPTVFDQGIESKSLMMIPERFALAMLDERDGLLNKLVNTVLIEKRRDGFSETNLCGTSVMVCPAA